MANLSCLVGLVALFDSRWRNIDPLAFKRFNKKLFYRKMDNMGAIPEDCCGRRGKLGFDNNLLESNVGGYNKQINLLTI
jgi:hypothetical protein